MDRARAGMGEPTKKRMCGDVLLVPMFMSGHINPMMHVAKGLMKRGLTMTMLLSEDETDVMKSHLEDEEGGDMEGFHLELVESRKNFRSAEPGILANSANFGLACEPYLKRLLAERQAGGGGEGRPKCMIADQFMGWSQSWATKLGIPRYVSIVSPATFGYAMYNHSANLKKWSLENAGEEDPVVDLPAIPRMRLSDLSRSAKASPAFLTSSGDTFDESEGLLINTFYELEAAVIDAFDAQIKSKGGKKNPKVLPIGPMLPPEFFSEGKYTGTSTSSECIRWLDDRPASSVVYVAFGSGGQLSPRQILELAGGLEASKESFLWVLLIKEAVDASTLLPPGFQERTKDRGLVYPKFAPQLQILSHPAIGGFLTHCGWNSVLEISRGVPMVGWPLRAEQKLCCRVIVDQAKVATEVRPGLNGGQDLVSSAEVVNALRGLMRQPEGQEVKMRAVELQSRAKIAVGPGGSSTRNFDTLMKDIQGVRTGVLRTQ